MAWCKDWMRKSFIQMETSMKEKLFRVRKVEMMPNTLIKIVINILADSKMIWNIQIKQFCTWIAKELCTKESLLKTRKLIQKLK
jgi:hypothetical protein